MFKKVGILGLFLLIITGCKSNKTEKLINYEAMIEDFVSNRENQVNYIKFPIEVIEQDIKKNLSQNEWKPFDYEGGVIRIFCSYDAIKKFKTIENLKKIKLNYIYPEKGISKCLYFLYDEYKWYLSKIKVNNENFKHKNSFIGFLNKFMNDSLFRKASIKYPLKFSYLDENSNYKEKTEISNTYKRLKESFELEIPSKILVEIQDYEATTRDSTTRILTFQEPGTGTSIVYYFKKNNSGWQLVEYKNLGI